MGGTTQDRREARTSDTLEVRLEQARTRSQSGHMLIYSTAGLHNRLRRDGGDKGKADEASSSSSKPKKEKKSTLRGIRGFV